MADSVVVRAVAEQDRAAWGELFRAYRGFYEMPPDEAVIDRTWAWIGDETHPVQALVAEIDDRVVGIAHWQRFVDPSDATSGLYLNDLFAAPDVRGHGVGRALIEALANIAAAEGDPVVRWITASDNARARRLYDSVATATEWVTYDLDPRARQPKAQP